MSKHLRTEMGKTYRHQKPADIDRSHALKPAKTKVRLNARDVYAALDETADERTNIIPTSDDPYAWVPGVGGRMHAKGE